MFKFAVPIILVGAAVAGFFLLINPYYKEITDLRAQMVSYNEALDNSKSLEAERDKLTQKYNSISTNDLARLQKLLPDNVDNIRLILEIEGIASPYGMVLKDVRYDTANQKAATAQNGAVQAGVSAKTNGDYGSWTLQFSTQGTYSNFSNFLNDLEKNLRIVDIASVDFSSEGGTSTAGQGGASLNSSSSDNYKYTFSIKTYWLKG